MPSVTRSDPLATDAQLAAHCPQRHGSHGNVQLRERLEELADLAVDRRSDPVAACGQLSF
jgi:hypothetical protein